MSVQEKFWKRSIQEAEPMAQIIVFFSGIDTVRIKSYILNKVMWIEFLWVHNFVSKTKTEVSQWQEVDGNCYLRRMSELWNKFL